MSVAGPRSPSSVRHLAVTAPARFPTTRHGITASTPDIPGGHLGRDAAGRPDGLVMDAACDLLTGDGGVKLGLHGPNLHLPPAPGEAARWLDHAQRAFLAAGVTSLVDAQVSQRELTAYTAALAEGRLQVRVGMRIISSYLPELLGLGLTGPFGGDLLDVTGVKIYADGTLGGCPAWFPCGYHGEAQTTGLLYHTPAELAEIIAAAHQAGLPTGTHAQSPGAIGLVVEAVEQVQARLGSRVRHTVEHCGLPTPDLVRRMTRAGIQPVMQPAHHASFGDGVLAAVGEELGQRYNPAGEYAAACSPPCPQTRPSPRRTRPARSGPRSRAGPARACCWATASCGWTQPPPSPPTRSPPPARRAPPTAWAAWSPASSPTSPCSTPTRRSTGTGWTASG